MAIASSLRNLSSYKAARPGSNAWNQQWQNAWTKANPGKTPPWQGTNPGVAPRPPYPVASGAAQNPTAATERMPWDTAYEQTVGAVNTSLQNINTGLVNDENALAADFGVQFDRAGDGTLTNFRLDPSNPFSKAALLQRAFQQRQKATTGQLASQGQLYSGYHQSKQDEAVFDKQQGDDSLLKTFGSNARAIQQRRLEAQTDARGQINAAGQDRLNTALNAPPAPAPAPASHADQVKAFRVLNSYVKNGRRYYNGQSGKPILIDDNGNIITGTGK